MDVNGSGILKVKLNIPVLSKNVVARERLEQKLSYIPDYKITVITAPAGYGKTTAAARFVSGIGCRTAWFSIDEMDNDPVSFWKYVIAALSDVHYEYREFFEELTISREIVENNIISKLLLDRLNRIPDKTVFVMDDFHLIDNLAIIGNLKYMAKYLPENLIILLTSRREMDEELSVLLSKGKVLSIDRKDMAFDAEEISVFYEKKGVLLNSKEIARVFSYTEGWAAGLVLSSIASDNKGIIREASAYSREKRQINRLLSDEVFFRWPERVKRFLVQTAILDRFSAPLCCAVTGLNDCAEIINILSVSNSFLIQMDDEGEWYRYHHLFSEFLKTKLKTEEREAVLPLYQRAGQWYCQNGYMQEAVDALIKGEAYKNAMALFWDVFLPLAGRGESSTLMNWLEKIPAEVHKYSAFYCFIYAYLLDMENRTEHADGWYRKALEAFEIKNYHMFDMNETVLRQLILCKSGLAVRRMDAKEIAACYEEAGKFDLPATDHGEINAYQSSLLKTYSLFQGRIKLLEEVFLSIYGNLEKCHHKTKAYFKVGQAEIFYERNCLDECLSLLMESLEAVLDLNYSGATVPFFFTLAKVKHAHKDTAGAFEALAECRKKLGRANALWEYIIDIFEAGLFLALNDRKAADDLLHFSRMDIYDEISNTSEFELYTYAKYLLQTGSPEKAAVLLSRLCSFAEKGNRLHSQIEILCLLSAAYCMNKNIDSADAALDKSLELGMEDGYIRTFLDEPRLEKVLSRYINKRKNGPDKKRNYAKRIYRLMVNRPQPGEDMAGDPEKQDSSLLSRKEHQVLKLVAGGCSNLEIAGELGISENTVKYHTKNIFSKLDVKNRQNAIIKAKETGLTQ